jgi:hypothetical protein
MASSKGKAAMNLTRREIAVIVLLSLLLVVALRYGYFRDLFHERGADAFRSGQEESNAPLLFRNDWLSGYAKAQLKALAEAENRKAYEKIMREEKLERKDEILRCREIVRHATNLSRNILRDNDKYLRARGTWLTHYSASGYTPDLPLRWQSSRDIRGEKLFEEVCRMEYQAVSQFLLLRGIRPGMIGSTFKR